MPVDNKVSPSIMPSESSFKHQIEQTRSVLAKFEAIAAVGFPAATQPALDEVITVTNDFHKFIPFFVNDPRFFEAPLQVYKVLEEFFAKNPTYPKPTTFGKVTWFFNRSKSTTASASAAKKGVSILFLKLSFLLSRLTFIPQPLSAPKTFALKRSPRREQPLLYVLSCSPL
jgi:hypothetical protein